MSRYAVSRAAAVLHDLRRIKAHLIESYHAFGDTEALAQERAASRLRDAASYMLSFQIQPHKGTVHPHLRDGVRHVTDRQFVYYFEIDEGRRRVTILAVFFGGEDHLHRFGERLTD